jgi:hypothetical protein
MFGLSGNLNNIAVNTQGFIQRNFSKNDYVFFSWHVEFCRYGALGNVGIEAFSYHHF